MAGSYHYVPLKFMSLRKSIRENRNTREMLQKKYKTVGSIVFLRVCSNESASPCDVCCNNGFFNAYKCPSRLCSIANRGCYDGDGWSHYYIPEEYAREEN